jgi:molecular chaperone GrpE (heat shock protein)
MKNWFNNLFNHRESTPAEGPAVDSGTLTTGEGPENTLRLQKEIQELRMELDSRERSLANLNQENERLRFRQEQVLNETVAARLEGLFNDLAAPASQILTQADLLENQDKPVQARDVLSVARRMVRALERNGLSFEGQVGQTVGFDPNRHTPLNHTAQPVLGQPVTVRFAGVLYEGKIIYKAIVE